MALTPQPNLPQWDNFRQGAQQPQAQPVAGGGFDIQAYINAMMQMAQMQQQSRQQMHTQDSGLGTVGTSNSRPMGQTDQSSWNRMFPSHEDRVSREEQVLGRPGYLGTGQDMQNYRPPQQTNAEAATGASPPPPFQPQQTGQSPFANMPIPGRPQQGQPFDPEAALQTNQQMYRPGGMAPQRPQRGAGGYRPQPFQ